MNLNILKRIKLQTAKKTAANIKSSIAKNNYKLNLNKKAISLLLIFAVVLFGLVIFIGNTVINIIYWEKILPNISVGNINLGKLTTNQAAQILQQKTDALKTGGLSYCYANRCLVVNSLIIAPNDPDLSSELITANPTEDASLAYRVGRSENIINNIFTKFKIFTGGINQPINWKVKDEEIKNILKNYFSKIEKPAINADIKITQQNNKYNIAITPATNGWRFNYERAINETHRLLSNLGQPLIQLEKTTDIPQITNIPEPETDKMVNDLLNGKEWKLAYDEKYWLIEKESLIPLLTVQKKDQTIFIALREKEFNELLDKIGPEIEQPVLDARFLIADNGKVTEFQNSQDGISINRIKTLDNINTILSQVTTSQTLILPIITEVAKSLRPTDSVNQLGIKEIIGIGTSNFSGSPKNRRHNIAVGANTLNGILIKPEEEFSLVKALGEINSRTGYLPELVIRGGQTIPEYGGGLCQIGTTTFRAALGSGLPITERKNHSYRVVYYEPAGTDATIYNPKPDLKFINDTGNYILIQTKIVGDELIFEFWGTNDGRIVEQTDPIIYNITSPGPTKYIETTELEVEKVKCIEIAHKGADTKFDYKVLYPNGEIKETTFASHYRPWQAVCLVGVEEISVENDTTETEGTTEGTTENNIIQTENL